MVKEAKLVVRLKYICDSPIQNKFETDFRITATKAIIFELSFCIGGVTALKQGGIQYMLSQKSQNLPLVLRYL